MSRRATLMHKQGNGWIVSTWDESVNCYRESGELTYWVARAAVGSDNCPNPKTCTKPSHHHEDQL